MALPSILPADCLNRSEELRCSRCDVPARMQSEQMREVPMVRFGILELLKPLEQLAFALQVLAEGGSFVAKVFQGGSERAMLDVLKRHFAVVRHAKPPASRKESSELYVVATGFRGGMGC